MVSSRSRCGGNNFGTVDTVGYCKKPRITRFTSRVSSELTVSVDAAGSYLAVGIDHYRSTACRNKLRSSCPLKIGFPEYAARHAVRFSSEFSVAV